AKMRERREHIGGLSARRDRKARGNQRVLDLKKTRKRQTSGVLLARMRDGEHLRKSLACNRAQTYGVSLAAERENPQTACLRGRNHTLGVRTIGGNHRCARWHDEIGEQSELCSEVSFQGGMIVEMVATEIREGTGRHTHAVEAMLIESM